MSNVKFPLSKREKVQLKEIQNAFSSTSSFGITNDEKSRLLDALSLLIERNIIVDLEIDNINAYRLIGSFDEFWNWVADQEKKAKKLNRREYLIAIFSAFLGWFIPFVLSNTIPYLISIFSRFYHA